MNWQAWTHTELGAIRRAQRWRDSTAFDAAGPEGEVRGERVISFASNDYLGLSTHSQVRAAAIAAIEQFGAGATASRLVIGTRSVHLRLEEALAEWQRAERALVFSTGFSANLAVLSVFGAEDVTIFSDALNHASIIDGCRLANARVEVFRHRDLEHLDFLMRGIAGRKLIVSDVVFSMEGDVAPVTKLAQLCARYDALLVLDEAHAVLEPVHDFPELPVLRVGTLSKTFGSLGGWVAGPKSMIELLVNRARSFIFTTALSPADTAAAAAALGIFRGAEGERLRARLRNAINAVRPGHPSPIVPVILGNDRTALAAAELLFAQGIYAPAIRPPSVPDGTARLRIALSVLHSDEMLQRLCIALAQLPAQLPAQLQAQPSAQ